MIQASLYCSFLTSLISSRFFRAVCSSRLLVPSQLKGDWDRVKALSIWGWHDGCVRCQTWYLSDPAALKAYYFLTFSTLVTAKFGTAPEVSGLLHIGTVCHKLGLLWDSEINPSVYPRPVADLGFLRCKNIWHCPLKLNAKGTRPIHHWIVSLAALGYSRPAQDET